MSEIPPTTFELFFEVFSRPWVLVRGVVEYVYAWFGTRRWGTFLVAAPAGLLVLAAGVIVAAGCYSDPATMAARYQEWAGLEMRTGGATAEESSKAEVARVSHISSMPAASRSGPRSLLDIEQPTSFGLLLFQRLMQLEGADARAKFMVADQVAAEGRRGQAISMMRAIAPKRESGFPAAHAWLVADSLINGPPISDTREDFLADLAIASKWEGAKPAIKNLHAELLSREGKLDEAFELLGSQAPNSESVAMKYAELAYRFGKADELSNAAKEMRARIEGAARAGIATPDDYLKMAKLLLMDGDPKRARIASKLGLELEPANSALLRALSESYRLGYVNSGNSKAGADLRLLETACRIDRSNPGVSEEVAKLVARGDRVSRELEEVLRSRVADGTATAQTLAILANRRIAMGNLSDAIPLLELALQKSPDSPGILNNLGLAIALTDRSRLGESESLINAAVQAAPTNAEYLDSQGEVRLLLGDVPGAIDCFERAIGFDQSRTSTRRKLASAYEAIGLPEMSRMQLGIIAGSESTGLEAGKN